MNRIIAIALAVVLLVTALAGCTAGEHENNAVYQVNSLGNEKSYSPIGKFDWKVTSDELMKDLPNSTDPNGNKHSPSYNETSDCNTVSALGTVYLKGLSPVSQTYYDFDKEGILTLSYSVVKWDDIELFVKEITSFDAEMRKTYGAPTYENGNLTDITGDTKIEFIWLAQDGTYLGYTVFPVESKVGPCIDVFVSKIEYKGIIHNYID